MERKHRAQNLRDRAGVQLDGVRNTPVPENLPLCTRQVSRCTQRVCLLRLFAGFECPRVAWHNDSHQVTNWNKLHKPRLRLTATITWRQRNSRETLCVPNNSHAVVVVTQQEAWAALGSCWESSFDISSIRQRLQEPGAAALGSGAALTFHSSREAKSVPRLVKCPPRLLYGTARLKDTLSPPPEVISSVTVGKEDGVLTTSLTFERHVVWCSGVVDWWSLSSYTTYTCF